MGMGEGGECGEGVNLERNPGQGIPAGHCQLCLTHVHVWFGLMARM